MENAVRQAFEIAQYLAVCYVQCIARKILRENDDLDEFVMGMGIWHFTSRYPNEIPTHEELRFRELEEFMMQWDEYLKITGEPMRFTATGNIVTDWY